MTFGAPYPLDADAIAEWNAGIKRARDAYNPEPEMCAECGAVPRPHGRSYCNPCKHRRGVARKARAA